MTQTDQPALQSESLTPLARVVWLLLILATLYFSYFQNLGVIGLVGPDEPRYAWIARDMAETGDWVTPRLYGHPWFEKPVLYYWGAALSFKWFGVSDAAARLPSAVVALMSTLAMGWLAWRLYGAETARWLLLLLPPTIAMIGFSHAAATDMPFAGMLTMAMACALVILHAPPSASPSALAFVLFGIFLGLAVLAKGPAALILSGGAVLLWAAVTKRWREAFRCFHPVSIATFCLTALPWYILCARRNPDFFRIFIIEHNFKRYLTPEFQHIQPFWFYVPVTLVAFLPWAVLFIWSVVLGIQRIRRSGPPGSPTLLLLCWAVFCLLFFSVSKSKLPGYILPAIPAIGLLLARAYVVFSRENETSLRWTMTIYSTISLLAGVGLIGFGKKLHASPVTGDAMIVAGCVTLAFALANMMLTLKARGFPVSALCVVPVLLLIVSFRPLSHPWLARDPSGKTLALELATAHIANDHIYAADMKRGQLYSLSFYLHREIEPWNHQASSGYLLVPSRHCQELAGPSLTCTDRPIQLGPNGWFAYRIEAKGQ